MDILIVILALMGLVLIPWGAGAGLSTILGNGSRYKDKTMQDLPELRKDYGNGVSVDRAYKDLENGRYNAYLSDIWSGNGGWVGADSLKELKEILEVEIPKLQERNRAYRRQRGIR